MYIWHACMCACVCVRACVCTYVDGCFCMFGRVVVGRAPAWKGLSRLHHVFPRFLRSFYSFVVFVCCLRLLSSFVVFVCCLRLLSSFVVFVCCLRLLSSFVVFVCCLRLLSSFVVFVCCLRLLSSFVGWCWMYVKCRLKCLILVKTYHPTFLMLEIVCEMFSGTNTRRETNEIMPWTKYRKLWILLSQKSHQCFFK